MRLSMGLIAVVALYTDAAAIAAAPVAVTLAAPVLPVADTTTPDDGSAPKSAGAPSQTPAGQTPAASPSAPPPAGGQIQVLPGQPQQPPQPPNLNVPPAPVTPPQPGQPAPENAPPPSPTFEQHQEPGPGGQDPNLPPRGTGAAMIPKQTPSGIQAIEDWVASWFQ